MNYNTAVIDIGSNSVRLVIYRVEGRSIWPIFNEKVLAGLGRDLKTTGVLHKGGVKESLIALRRFKAILETYNLNGIHAVATAAIREAEDGRDFVAQVLRMTGFSVRILSGAEEAWYSALGVRCGHLDAHGVVGDLGGSSLELIDLDGHDASAGITLPLGPFALGAPKPIDLDKTYPAIREQLTPLKGRFANPKFHAVGGAWRNLALIWMMKQHYPLQIVQQFELPAREALEISRLIASQSLSSLEKLPGVSKRRLENISYAALVLQGLIEELKFETLCFSAFGLREGLLFESLGDDLKRDDPLIAGCAALGARLGINDDLGPALGEWAMDFYASLDQEQIESPSEKLIRSAAKLSDIGARLHPDHRADLASDQVLRAPIPGQNHEERVFLACAVYTRYSGDTYTREPVLTGRILGEDKLRQATQLGLLLRLGCDLSAKSARLLVQSHVTQDQGQLVLSAKAGWEDLLLGEQTRRRARALAQSLKLNLNIVTYP
ncbi:Ppx/GppA phosphatase family protein [Asticcacaulis sp. EMRT-3]|uniref:Ppx/GppA phosphatase family protein n=1 Tax=Asticcacaulis sp. EMRT-3 TaxID=3040349 RepID=UPI0024AFC09E|nr:Ppx/GppA phosphatase family protein [Asticcacaulis sp. EMRT-3]MDI7774562.1 Ppx/GppA phosphatase family protein [Asticcacaulis sp. EMRT-3]